MFDFLVVKIVKAVCVPCLAVDKFPYIFFHTANNLPFLDENFFIY